jgi:hypothetical protein
MIKIPINYYNILIEQTQKLYRTLTYNFLNTDNFKNITESVILDIIYNLYDLKINLNKNKDIQFKLLDIKDNNEIKELILNKINKYEILLNITKSKDINYKFVIDLYEILKMDNIDLNDLDQYYKLNDIDYLISNKLFYSIDIITSIIISMLLIEFFLLMKF